MGFNCGRCGRYMHDPEGRCYFCYQGNRARKRGGSRGRKTNIPAHTKPETGWPEEVSAAALEAAILRAARELARATRKGRGGDRHRLIGAIVEAAQLLNRIEGSGR